MAKIELRST